MIYLGVEYGAKFVLEGPNGTRAVFNDSTDADYVGDLSPESSGLDAPEMREDSASRVEADGAIFGDFFADKRPVILQGTIIATSKAQRNERVGKLRAASDAKTTNATLWWEDAAAGKLRVDLRRQQPLRVTGGWVKTFQLSMVAADSRILSYNLGSVEDTEVVLKTSSIFAPGNVSAVSYNGTGAWTNINNVKAADAVFATTTSKQPQAIVANTFSLGVPSTAIVKWVVTEVTGKSSVANNFAWTQTFFGVNMTAGLAGLEEAENDTTYVVGDPASLQKFSTTNTGRFQEIGTPGTRPEYAFKHFGAHWAPTPAMLNAPNFGVGVIFEGLVESPGTLSIDAVRVGYSYYETANVVVTNQGNVHAPAVIKVTGPLNEPLLINSASGETFRYSGFLEAGRTLVIDTEAFTIVEEGTGIVGPVNRYDNVAVGSEWLQIQPGSNQVLLGGEEGTSATKLKVEYRSAWE
jgi:hypothetical protein